MESYILTYSGIKIEKNFEKLCILSTGNRNFCVNETHRRTFKGNQNSLIMIQPSTLWQPVFLGRYV